MSTPLPKAEIDAHLKAAEEHEKQSGGTSKAVEHYLAAAEIYLTSGNFKYCRELCAHALELDPSNSRAGEILTKVPSQEVLEADSDSKRQQLAEPQETVINEGISHNGKPVDLQHVANAAVVVTSGVVVGAAGVATTAAVGWTLFSGCALLFPYMLFFFCLLMIYLKFS